MRFRNYPASNWLTSFSTFFSGLGEFGDSLRRGGLRSAAGGHVTAQNIYDDPDFLAGYETLDRQVRGLDGAAEWPALQALLPELTDVRVMDLGCGFGWFSRWAADAGAASVLGVDVSIKMLDRAKADTTATNVTYQRSDLDDFVAADDSCDSIFSSLTFHYVKDLDRLLSMAARAITTNGSLVFSVEHPIYSAPSSQSFEVGANSQRIWPLDNYLVEGERITRWFVDGVRKEHRTLATYVNAVIDAGFRVDRIVEWGPTAAEVSAHPERADDLDRPWFLLVRATRLGD